MTNILTHYSECPGLRRPSLLLSKRYFLSGVGFPRLGLSAILDALDKFYGCSEFMNKLRRCRCVR